MARSRLTVVVSQAQGKHPAKRALEEAIVTALLVEPGIEAAVIPHLYDLDASHPGQLFLESIKGDMVLMSWLYPRAAFWLLDRNGIKGHEGKAAVKPPEDEDESAAPPQGIGAANPPDRYIYCLDLRDSERSEDYLAEIRRIAAECRDRQKPGRPQLVELGLRLVSQTETPNLPTAEAQTGMPPKPVEILQPPGRRWYPVIDYSRCTNCLECLDFCLFGVYGVDDQQRIIVDQQDNCKKGCPACSRVCPEHAIMFPEYKSAPIAGAPVGGIDNLKIDLTKLFGGADALSIAAQERDRELIKDGRQAVGLSVGIPKRQAGKPMEARDDLDRLMDSLDALDL